MEGIVSESTGWWKEDWLVEGKVSLQWLVEGIVSESTGWWKEDWLVEGKVSESTGWWKEKLVNLAPKTGSPLH